MIVVNCEMINEYLSIGRFPKSILSSQVLIECNFKEVDKFCIICCPTADPKLPSLLKMLIWAQSQLDEKAHYPRINDLSTARLEDPSV